jgi:methionyl aminopeptidase
MITVKKQDELKLMRRAGQIVYDTHQLLRKNLNEGMTTKELDNIAYNFIVKEKGYPSFKDYQGFPGSICVSINDEVVHGIPSSKKIKNGDIVSIDIGVIYEGYHADSAWTYAVGEITDEKKYLLIHTEQALYEGLKTVKDGSLLNEIGQAIEKYATSNKLGVVKELVGHGIGRSLHEEPDIPNFQNNSKIILREGMTIAIEPMINLRTPKIRMLGDGWTIVTKDKRPSAHFEHTILVTKQGYEILTKR